MALTKVTGDVSILPYDIAFLAGFDGSIQAADCEVRTYGEMVMARDGIFSGEAGYADTAPVGSDLIVDIQIAIVAGANTFGSIYTTNPRIVDGESALTVGVLNITSFTGGDRIRFLVTQVGSTTAGQGVRFMLKCEV
tara:strand:+ start:1081 stop:1491 length:411 start_codon:yes stop_codon:yes gene_type:complete